MCIEGQIILNCFVNYISFVPDTPLRCRLATSNAPFAVTMEYSGSIQYMEHIVVSMSVSVATSTLSGIRGDI